MILRVLRYQALDLNLEGGEKSVPLAQGLIIPLLPSTTIVLLLLIVIAWFLSLKTKAVDFFLTTQYPKRSWVIKSQCLQSF